MTSVAIAWTAVVVIVELAVLAWVFAKTKKIAALVYMAYLTCSWLLFPTLQADIFSQLENGEPLAWLGNTTRTRVQTALLLYQAITATIQAALFTWLLLSLTQTRNRPS